MVDEPFDERLARLLAGHEALLSRPNEIDPSWLNGVFERYRLGPADVLSYDRHWWGQAEGLVGFYNAFQLSGRSELAEASYRL